MPFETPTYFGMGLVLLRLHPRAKVRHLGTRQCTRRGDNTTTCESCFWLPYENVRAVDVRAEYPFEEHCSPESLGWLQRAGVEIEGRERRVRRDKRRPAKRVKFSDLEEVTL